MAPNTDWMRDDGGCFSISLFLMFLTFLVGVVSGMGVLTIFLSGGWDKYIENNIFIIFFAALVFGFLDVILLAISLIVLYVIGKVIYGVGKQLYSKYQLKYETLPEPTQL